MTINWAGVLPEVVQLVALELREGGYAGAEYSQVLSSSSTVHFAYRLALEGKYAA